MPEKTAQALSDSDQLVESHENRIVRLESGVQDVSAGLASNTATVESLSNRIEDGFRNISEKIDNLISPLTEKLKDHINEDLKTVGKFETVAEKVEIQDDRVKLLEADQEARKQKNQTLKKVFGGLALAAAGAIVKQLISWILG